jgi:hypothetical protein
LPSLPTIFGPGDSFLQYFKCILAKCALAQMSRVENNFFTYTTNIELHGDEKKPKSPSHMQQLISNPKNLPKLKPYGFKI